MFEIEGALGPTAPEYKFRFRLFDNSIVDEGGAEDELVPGVGNLGSQSRRSRSGIPGFLGFIADPWLVLSGVQLVDPAVVVVVLEAEAFEARRLLLQGQLGQNQ